MAVVGDILDLADVQYEIRWLVPLYGTILRRSDNQECQIFTAHFTEKERVPGVPIIKIDGVEYIFVTRATAQDW